MLTLERIVGRKTSNIQCRPCGHEWEPCCADVETLCSDGFVCYAEQDRCVMTEYVAIKEDFAPAGAAFDTITACSLYDPEDLSIVKVSLLCVLVCVF